MNTFLGLNKLSNLQQRVITAVIGGLFFLFCLTFNEWTYLGLILLVSVLGQIEFYGLIREDGDDPLTKWGLINGVLLNLICYFVARGDIETKYFFLFFVLLGIIYISELYRKASNPFENIAYTILGVFYVAMPLALLHFASFSNGYFSFQIASGCFFLLWASDTGAYFAGRNFGKTKLFPRISPNKTWEGFMGGLLASIVLAIVLSNYYQDLHLWKWIVLSVIICIGGTYGDLIESMLKRSLQVKDSGNMIPGHGGVLDRFDGLLMAAPFAAFFLMFF
jgi:phosphatidate cytidylyltransferase